MPKKRTSTKTEIWAVRNVLSQRFPNCFRGHGTQKIPLKKRIYDDIRKRLGEECHALGITHRTLKSALADYCRGDKYLLNMVAGRMRVDLDGRGVEPVAPGDEARAQHTLLHRRKARRIREAARQRKEGETANAVV